MNVPKLFKYYDLVLHKKKDDNKKDKNDDKKSTLEKAAVDNKKASKAKKLLNWQPKNSDIKKIIKDEILWVMYLIKNKQFRKFKNYL